MIRYNDITTWSKGIFIIWLYIRHGQLHFLMQCGIIVSYTLPCENSITHRPLMSPVLLLLHFVPVDNNSRTHHVRLDLSNDKRIGQVRILAADFNLLTRDLASASDETPSRNRLRLRMRASMDGWCAELTSLVTWPANVPMPDSWTR